MLIHCTKKLTKIVSDVSTTPLVEKSPLGSWHCNFFIVDRRRYFLFCHDDTRYCIFIPGLRNVHFQKLDERFKKAFVQSIGRLDLSSGLIRRAALALGTITFDTCTNRSVLGSLNRMSLTLTDRVQEIENVISIFPPAITHSVSHYPVNQSDRDGVCLAEIAMRDRIVQLSAGN